PMLPDLLDEDKLSSVVSGGNAGGAGAGEGVKHHVASIRERLDERFDDLDGLLCRMQRIARVVPLQNIINRLCRPLWSAFSQKKQDFVEAPGVSLAGRIL